VIRGLNERGEAVSEARIIRSVNNEINPWQDFAGYLALARNRRSHSYFQTPPKRASAITPETGLTISRRSASGEADPTSLEFRHFNGAADKGWTIIL
jgi:tagaturonate reductase